MKSVSVRMDEKTLHKLHVLSEYNARSANSQIVYLIRKAIEKYEKINGEIDIKC